MTSVLLSTALWGYSPCSTEGRPQSHAGAWDSNPSLSPGPTHLPLYFLNLKHLCFLTGDTLLAIQAPAGTQLEVPLPEMVGGAGQSGPTGSGGRPYVSSPHTSSLCELSGIRDRVLILNLGVFSTWVKL